MFYLFIYLFFSLKNGCESHTPQIILPQPRLLSSASFACFLDFVPTVAVFSISSFPYRLFFLQILHPFILSSFSYCFIPLSLLPPNPSFPCFLLFLESLRSLVFLSSFSNYLSLVSFSSISISFTSFFHTPSTSFYAPSSSETKAMYKSIPRGAKQRTSEGARLLFLKQHLY